MGPRRMHGVQGLDLRDAPLHVPMHSEVRKYLRFKWRKKLYEWQVLPVELRNSPWILVYMVKPILSFLQGQGISLTAFMDDFTNQAVCQCRAILKIHVIALVFMWSIDWPKTKKFLDPLRTTDPSGVPIGPQGEGYRPAQGQNHLSGNLDPTADSDRVSHSGGSGVPSGDTHQLYPSCVAGPH